ncbi:MAG: hypothetical protein V4576_04400 [Patescibacteria group bacterium]
MKDPVLKKFWEAYELFAIFEFAEPVYAEQLISIMRAHQNAVLNLTRPDKGWTSIVGWLALRGRAVSGPKDAIQCDIRAGDVIVPHKGWSKDLILTTVPVLELPHTALMSVERSEGIFLPLFDPKHVIKLVEVQAKKASKRRKALLDEFEKMWSNKGKAKVAKKAKKVATKEQAKKATKK